MAGTVAGIVAGIVAAVITVIAALIPFLRRQHRATQDRLQSSDLSTQLHITNIQNNWLGSRNRSLRGSRHGY
ncbi:hypothetical protein K469DRAFT_701102 [Zopfia rhizophila CBS 207.26]|uniref:Uncharacterized protein n=1 Tax=Zopfia rhizophila CBS 207.26 TaxID=1314779 RepID=A0A6A6EGZ1_9PEZI|nr:hypothetical protein K469DRAFT_701102 [Zopfia rhizophila CBS 207.26]